MPKLINPNFALGDENNSNETNFDDILIDEEAMKRYDFSKAITNDPDLERKRDMAIKYINSKNDHLELLENPFAHILLNFICNSSAEHKFKEQMPKVIERYVQVSYEKKAMSLLDYQIENIDKLQFRSENEEESKKVYSRVNLVKVQLITLLNITDCSILFCEKLYDANVIEILFKIIKHGFLLSVLKNLVQLELTLQSVIHDLFKNAAGILFNLSKLKDKFINEWTQVNATRSLLNLVNSMPQESFNTFKR
jgi:hypothetical protein